MPTVFKVKSRLENSCAFRTANTAQVCMLIIEQKQKKDPKCEQNNKQHGRLGNPDGDQ